MCVLTHSAPVPPPDKLKLAACYSQSDRLLPLHMQISFSLTDVIQMHKNFRLLELEKVKTYKKYSLFSLVLFQVHFKCSTKAGKVPT
jgi:hypothetical protein